MPVLTFEYRDGGVYLPRLALWLDPQRPKIGSDKVFVSHAHSDHIGAHREVILSAPTARFMQARLKGERLEHVLPFNQPDRFFVGELEYQITLLPAGHILGSAMAFIEAHGESLLYTGDFKLARGLAAELCEPSRARGTDVLIMETTFGRPCYQFPSAHDVLEGVIQFCREAIAHGETPVLLSYSLGKSQELLQGLTGSGLPVMVHEQVFKMTQIYKQFGHRFPRYEKFAADSVAGKVLIWPPNANRSGLLDNLGTIRTACVSGWAIDPGCRFRNGTDAAFPLSDHADFPDLIEFVNRVAPKRICTLHGFAADFAQSLRDLGYNAHALSEPDQLGLPLFRVNGEAVASSQKCRDKNPDDSPTFGK